MPPSISPFSPRVAYQGIAGAFGEEAIWRLWDKRAVACASPTFASALTAVVNGAVDYAVIPIWNSTIGDIEPACSALGEFAAETVKLRDIDLPVRHNLLARAGTALNDIRYVGSHPAALAQCSQLFSNASVLVPCEANDTAGAALELARYGEHHEGDPEPWYAPLRLDDASQLATIASARAAMLYGLVILRKDLQDDPTNLTRFVVLRARTPSAA